MIAFKSSSEGNVLAATTLSVTLASQKGPPFINCNF